MCVRACVRVCVRACVRACVRVCVSSIHSTTHALVVCLARHSSRCDPSFPIEPSCHCTAGGVVCALAKGMKACSQSNIVCCITLRAMKPHRLHMSHHNSSEAALTVSVLLSTTCKSCQSFMQALIHLHLTILTDLMAQGDQLDKLLLGCSVIVW